MAEYGLGRIHRPDERDKNYLMASVLQKVSEEEIPTRKMWWDKGAQYDQGNTGTCVGHAWAHWVEDGPIRHPDEVIDPMDLYCDLVKWDPWTQNDTPCDLQFGSTVRAGAQELLHRGWIGSYWWAWEIEAMKIALKIQSPVVIGINWYDPMFTPVPRLFSDGKTRSVISIPPGAKLAGGHALTTTGIIDEPDLNIGLVKVKNSWGPEWGDNGHGWLEFATMDRLIQEDGEACLCVEVKQ
jgi:hypothetical protein